MRTRSDSTRYALNEAKALAEGMPTPPQKLNADAVQYWPAIVGSKRATAWTDSDLLLACQLARDLAMIEQLSDTLEAEGDILTDAKGKKYAHPAGNLLDQASRRIISTQRALQLHAIATTGKTDHQGQKNATARDLAHKLAEADSDLIPRAKH